MDKKKGGKSALAANIVRLRNAMGVTQARLVAQSGVTSIAMIESGEIKSPREKSLKAIAKVLGVTIADLWENNDQAGQAETPPVLIAFLRSPGGKDATPEEVEQLRKLRARGKRPTEDTYFWALKMLRSMTKDG